MAVLHPKYKLAYFRKKGWKAAWIERARLLVEEDFKEKYLNINLDNNNQGQGVEQREGDDDEDREEGELDLVDDDDDGLQEEAAEEEVLLAEKDDEASSVSLFLKNSPYF